MFPTRAACPLPLLFSALTTTPIALGFVPRATRKVVSPFSATGGPFQVKPVSVGSAVPKTILTNQDLESIVDTTDEWIQTRTGISQRHVMVDNERLRDLETAAALEALGAMDPLDVDLVICATSTPDDMYGDAATVAHLSGCRNAFAFDLTAACSGFLFGVITACQFLESNKNMKSAVVIGADALSRWADWKDRNTCVLGGDASGAMVLSRTEGGDAPGILGYAAHSNGEGYPSLNCPYTRSESPVELLSQVRLTSGSYAKTTMNGKEVYKFATIKVPLVLEEALETAGIAVDDIDWLLLHQANIRIIEAVAGRLGIPMSKVITNIDKYGNTSAASIPLALTEAVRAGKVKPGDVIACSGFGAGLSWGAVIMKWGGTEEEQKQK